MAFVDLDDILARLNDPDPKLRIEAVYELRELDHDQAAAALVNRLDDQHPQVREEVAKALLEMGGRKVVARLVPLLSVERVGLRNRAREMLKEIGKDAPDLILGLLDDPDRDLRLFAAEILEGVRSPHVVRPLLFALMDPDPNVRAAAAVSLGRQGESVAVGALVDHLDDEEWVAFSAVEALAYLGDPAALEPLLNALENGSPMIKVRVAEALSRFPDTRTVQAVLRELPQAEGLLLRQLLITLLKVAPSDVLRGLSPEMHRKAVTGLLEALEDPSISVRCDALLGLALLGDESVGDSILEVTRNDPEPEVAELVGVTLLALGDVDNLVKLLESPNPHLAEIAVEALARLDAEGACEDLARALKHPAASVRRAAARHLAHVDDQDPLQYLLTALSDPDRQVQLEAVHSLGHLGRHQAIPALENLLDSHDPRLHQATVDALVQIGGPQVERFFLAGLEHSLAIRRRLCALGLGRLGSRRAEERLQDLLDDPDAGVRAAVVVALLELAGDDAEKLAGLQGLLADPEPRVRLTLVERLARLPGQLGEDLLLLALKDPDFKVRLKTVESLGQKRAAAAISHLLEMLDNEHPELRAAAAQALGFIGGQQSLPRLMTLLSDQAAPVRAAALDAIQRIEGGWE